MASKLNKEKCTVIKGKNDQQCVIMLSYITEGISVHGTGYTCLKEVF